MNYQSYEASILILSFCEWVFAERDWSWQLLWSYLELSCLPINLTGAATLLKPWEEIKEHPPSCNRALLFKSDPVFIPFT